MQTDNSIPYPRPNYKDGDLLTKELINGTFGIAMFSDLQNFKVPMDRYNVTEDKLTEKSLIHGNIQPQDYDISMRDLSLDGAKELGWLPAKRISTVPEPIVVYDPLKHYAFVEWVGINSTDLQQTIVSSLTVRYKLDTIHYDYENAGLLGFKEIRDVDDTTIVLERYAMFYSLKTLTLTPLGKLPNGYDLAQSTYVGYVKDAYILRFIGGTYLSFTFDGGVHILSGLSDGNTPLGDDKTIAIENIAGTKTAFYDEKLEPKKKTVYDTFGNPIIVDDEVVGRFCTTNGLFTSSPTKYVLGTKIDSVYFFVKDDTHSYKFKNTRNGWLAETVDSDAWKYGKRLKYDYATDNWLKKPLKTLKYNTIKQGLYIKNRFPKHEDGEEVEFPNSDMYGDFCRVVKADGSRTYYHTFNFRKFDLLTGDATQYIYGCNGRVWFKDRVDGVSGLMPYSIELKSVNDFQGGRKTVLQFSGFIFRGGQ